MEGHKSRKPRIGRPPTPLKERRRNRVMLNLTDEEYRQLERAAGGEAASAFARRIVLRYLTRRRT